MGKRQNQFVVVGVWIVLPVFVLNFISAFLHFVLYSFTYEKLVISKKVMARNEVKRLGNGSDPLSVPVRLEY